MLLWIFVVFTYIFCLDTFRELFEFVGVYKVLQMCIHS